MSRSTVLQSLQSPTPFHRAAWDSLGRWLRGTSGGAVVEYGLLVALVIAAVVLAAEGTGLMSQNSFDTLASGMREGKGAVPAGAAPARPEFVATAADTYEEPLLLGRIGLTIALLAAGGAVWFFLIRKRRPSALAESAVLAQLVPATNSAVLFQKRQQILRMLQSDVEQLLGGQIIVRYLMSERLTKVTPRASLEGIKSLMEEHAMRHILVCETDGQLLGIISDRDLHKRRGGTAGEIMTRQPITVGPDTEISPAITLMMQKKISCLPVVYDGKLVGVFTTTDIMMALQCALQLLQKVGFEAVRQAAAEEPSREESLATAG